MPKEAKMSPDEYQELALRTANPDCELLSENYILGICGECGELIDYLKKILFHGHAYLPEIAAKEFGDVMWYLAVNLKGAEIPLGEVVSDAKNDYSPMKMSDISQLTTAKRLILLHLQVSSFAEAMQIAVEYGANHAFSSNIKAKAVAVYQVLHILACGHVGNMEYVMDLNIQKLRERYPKRFTKQESQSRVEYSA